ncbi:alanine dehydrogenase [Brevibacterium salitolerans]|uniref:Alanine dehydrogenase n=1 Tax=Brevibacterium salitolerans TaxID=1403566 RepID=A0ABN2X858_9MICO
MRIGVPTEIKSAEKRVALTPAGVHQLVEHGHEVRVQAGAGLGSHLADEDYAAAGARIVATAAEAWGESGMVVKVKEPLPEEHAHLREDLILFTYLHLAAAEDLTRAVLAAGTTAIAYETVQPDAGGLPLLAPMSEIAGRLSVQEGAHHLLAAQGGRGVLLPGVPGVDRAKVTIVGAGVAGASAARAAVGMGAQVEIFDISLPRLRYLDEVFDGRLQTKASSPLDIAESVARADLVVGSVLIPGHRAPKLVTDEMVAAAKPGSVFVDIAIDQGGCFAGSRPTTYAEPTFERHGALFYCVANMPGGAPVTATKALTNATTPYILRIADGGWREALRADRALARGLNAHGGTLTNAAVAEAFGLDSVQPEAVLAG